MPTIRLENLETFSYFKLENAIYSLVNKTSVLIGDKNTKQGYRHIMFARRMLLRTDSGWVFSIGGICEFHKDAIVEAVSINIQIEPKEI